MPFISKEDQAKSSKAWYEANKSLVAQRKSERDNAYTSLRRWFISESMGRWVSPSEIVKACADREKELKMSAGKISDRMIASFPTELLSVGMIGGEVPFKAEDPEFDEFVDVLKKPYRKRIPIELYILQLQIAQADRRYKWINRYRQLNK